MNTMSDKVINFIKETMKNWWVELTVGGKSYSWGEHLERHILGKCTFTITICYSNHITYSHIKKMLQSK